MHAPPPPLAAARSQPPRWPCRPRSPPTPRLLRTRCLPPASTTTTTTTTATAATTALHRPPTSEIIDTHACILEYLERVGFGGSNTAAPSLELPPPTLETLFALHRAHALSVAFENLSVVHPRLRGAPPVTTEIGAVFDKLVRGGRGGW